MIAIQPHSAPFEVLAKRVLQHNQRSIEIQQELTDLSRQIGALQQEFQSIQQENSLLLNAMVERLAAGDS